MRPVWSAIDGHDLEKVCEGALVVYLCKRISRACKLSSAEYQLVLLGIARRHNHVFLRARMPAVMGWLEQPSALLRRQCMRPWSWRWRAWCMCPRRPPWRCPCACYPGLA